MKRPERLDHLGVAQGVRARQRVAYRTRRWFAPGEPRRRQAGRTRPRCRTAARVRTLVECRGHGKAQRCEPDHDLVSIAEEAALVRQLFVVALEPRHAAEVANAVSVRGRLDDGVVARYGRVAQHEDVVVRPADRQRCLRTALEDLPLARSLDDLDPEAVEAGREPGFAIPAPTHDPAADE